MSITVLAIAKPRKTNGKLRAIKRQLAHASLLLLEEHVFLYASVLPALDSSATVILCVTIVSIFQGICPKTALIYLQNTADHSICTSQTTTSFFKIIETFICWGSKTSVRCIAAVYAWGQKLKKAFGKGQARSCHNSGTAEVSHFHADVSISEAILDFSPAKSSSMLSSGSARTCYMPEAQTS